MGPIESYIRSLLSVGTKAARPTPAAEQPKLTVAGMANFFSVDPEWQTRANQIKAATAAGEAREKAERRRQADAIDRRFTVGG